MEVAASTIVDALMQHASERAADSAFTFLRDGEIESGTRRFLELDLSARRVANGLASRGFTGKTVLLLLRGTLQFIDALLGCFYAGAIAVPIAVPRPGKPGRSLTAIARSANVSAILTCRGDMVALRPGIETLLPGTQWLEIEEIAEADEPPARLPHPDQIAFLQYTSGSTGSPKGVIITHRNLMANQVAIHEAMGTSQESVFVGWLPLFHDMGLVGNVLHPLYLGIPSVLMLPAAFLQKPIRWLSTITRYRGTVSGAPNFAYDLCVRKCTPEQVEALDLSSWRVAFNGSEPVRAETLERFSRAFEPAGFRRRSLFPCYGMAESTLIVTGAAFESEPIYSGLPGVAAGAATDSGQTQFNTGRKRVVSCGTPVRGTEVLIVDPARRCRVADGVIGEIWIRGDSISPGYFRAPDATAATFKVRLESGSGDPWLRTGDLGFVREGQLFVTGRMKDIIIVRGANHYPQDLEETAGTSNVLLARGGGAALTLENERGSSVVIVHEVTREGWSRADPEELTADIREAISGEHGLFVDVLLIKPGSLPRTSSGKVQRSTCRELIEKNEFELLSRNKCNWIAGPDGRES